MNPESCARDLDEMQVVTNVRAALGVIGGKWKLLIIAHLIAEPKRYGELRRALPEITEKMLIQHLRELEADGIVWRTNYDTNPPKVEYGITEHGRSVCKVVIALNEWGAEHLRVTR